MWLEPSAGDSEGTGLCWQGLVWSALTGAPNTLAPPLKKKKNLVHWLHQSCVVIWIHSFISQHKSRNISTSGSMSGNFRFWPLNWNIPHLSLVRDFWHFFHFIVDIQLASHCSNSLCYTQETKNCKLIRDNHKKMLNVCSSLFTQQTSVRHTRQTKKMSYSCSNHLEDHSLVRHRLHLTICCSGQGQDS